MEKLEKITLYNADCMDVMRTFKDNQFDLAIVDKINMILLLLYQSIFVSLYQIKTI
jgi:DNA modification methylase